MKIDRDNYDTFILNGQLALEDYNDFTGKDTELCDEYFKIIEHYRKNRKEDELEKVVSKLIEVLEKIGLDNFIFYGDGALEYDIKKGVR